MRQVETRKTTGFGPLPTPADLNVTHCPVKKFFIFALSRQANRPGGSPVFAVWSYFTTGPAAPAGRPTPAVNGPRMILSHVVRGRASSLSDTDNCGRMPAGPALDASSDLRRNCPRSCRQHQQIGWKAQNQRGRPAPTESTGDPRWLRRGSGRFAIRLVATRRSRGSGRHGREAYKVCRPTVTWGRTKSPLINSRGSFL